MSLRISSGGPYERIARNFNRKKIRNTDFIVNYTNVKCKNNECQKHGHVHYSYYCVGCYTKKFPDAYKYVKSGRTNIIQKMIEDYGETDGTENEENYQFWTMSGGSAGVIPYDRLRDVRHLLFGESITKLDNFIYGKYVKPKLIR